MRRVFRKVINVSALTYPPALPTERIRVHETAGQFRLQTVYTKSLFQRYYEVLKEEILPSVTFTKSIYVS